MYTVRRYSLTAGASYSSAWAYDRRETHYNKRTEKQLGLKRWAQNVIKCWNAGFSGYSAVKTRFEEIKKSEGGESTTLCTSGESPKRKGHQEEEE